MNELEFIKKYGHLPLTLFEIYNHRITMKNEENKITVFGTLGYNSCVCATETILSFSIEVDNFNFEIE